MKFLERPAVHLVLIALLGLLAYANTLDVPFQWDDKYLYIVKNPVVKDFSYFVEPSRVESLGFYVYETFKNRYVGYLTFALDFKINGLDVRGYHIVNAAIHLLNACLVYCLIASILRTPFLRGFLSNKSGAIALFTGLFFVSHPIHTQAVTYISQRFTSLSALFCLASLLAYIWSRLATKGAVRYAMYFISLALTGLAMKTKENTFILPLVILLYEFLFHQGKVRIRILSLIPFLLTMAIIPLTLADIGKPLGEIISGTGQNPSFGNFSTRAYLTTQFRVLITYMRLLLIPINQNLDYDYPVFRSFFNVQVLLSVATLIVLCCSLLYVFYRYRQIEPSSRLIFFGGLYFFVTISVESSVIALNDVIAEHRLYLPSFGAIVSLVTGAFLLCDMPSMRKAKTFIVSALVVMVLVFTYAAHARNVVWESEISLWEDVVKKSPRKARGYNNLGLAYYSTGQLESAIKCYKTALRHDPYDTRTYNNLGVAYYSEGLYARAIENYTIALRFKDDAETHNNLGAAYGSAGMVKEAVKHFQLALKLKPDYAEARNNLDVLVQITKSSIRQ